MSALIDTLRDLVVANRILANEGVVDAFGHISVRHPDDPGRFLMSRSRSPALVGFDDILEFGLDGALSRPDNRAAYAERYIHAAIYEARPDVMSVVHNHSYDVIPFTITKTPLRPVVHVGSVMGAEAPVWDIHDRFGDTNMLVVNLEQGRDLAAALGERTVVLMRGHGCAVAGAGPRAAVMAALYTQVNARLQLQALQQGEVTYLTPGEIALTEQAQLSALALDRAWEYLRVRAGCDEL